MYWFKYLLAAILKVYSTDILHVRMYIGKYTVYMEFVRQVKGIAGSHLYGHSNNNDNNNNNNNI